MPSSESVLSSLTAIANEWRTLAIAWHVALATLLLATLAGWRPSNRLLGLLLVSPILSVSAMAWASGNPFNGATFAALALLLVTVASRLSPKPVQLSPPFFLVPGTLLVAFAWVYPHFLETDRWRAYAYAAPLGLIPCPTLSLVVGVTLMFCGLQSRAWGTTLAAAGLAYGAIGVFRLGVALDYPLLTGALLLGAAVQSPSTARAVAVPPAADRRTEPWRSTPWRSVRPDPDERTRGKTGQLS
jgi:hypothetical protein